MPNESNAATIARLERELMQARWRASQAVQWLVEMLTGDLCDESAVEVVREILTGGESQLKAA